ncbi:MAG: iron-sulfur cluster repair di-iron protein [Chitinophagaceae bacterium]|nr:MAG: iron-sulfur cluster repair di-iron protein [Chitinophagaceae bacterium]
MNTIANKTLSQIVTEHYGAARVFEKWGLDFCCRGKRALNEACFEKGAPLAQVFADLEEVLGAQNTAQGPDFSSLSITELADYIVRVHHGYIRLCGPQTFNYVAKVASKHGDRFPHLRDIHLLFGELLQELAEHMAKEEKILFPRMKQLERNDLTGTPGDFLLVPVSVMEDDHELAGGLMTQIRVLASDYRTPEGAGGTHRLALAALRAFEEDLHQHVHLENNILFPKALRRFAEQSC